MTAIIQENILHLYYLYCHYYSATQTRTTTYYNGNGVLTESRLEPELQNLTTNSKAQSSRSQKTPFTRWLNQTKFRKPLYTFRNHTSYQCSFGTTCFISFGSSSIRTHSIPASSKARSMPSEWTLTLSDLGLFSSDPYLNR